MTTQCVLPGYETSKPEEAALSAAALSAQQVQPDLPRRRNYYMENDKLLKLLEDHTMTDEEAVGMIFSNFIDIGGTLVGLTVENAIKAGALLREYDKRSSSRSRNDLQDSSRIKTRMAHERVSLNPGNGPSV